MPHAPTPAPSTEANRAEQSSIRLSLKLFEERWREG